MIADKILKEQFQNLVQQTIQEEQLSEKSQDFFQDNKSVVQKKLKPYTATRIKSRNFLLKFRMPVSMTPT